ncbi:MULTISPECIES: hypothetical protein [Gemella]|uniref:hypothetical protein n=1 Tax=Gemella TaxID=1378 RepID=UPI0007683F57|nr:MULTISPECIES: hypothetical protein [Gemella]AME08880.1 hypothetical protein AXE85_01065 [Gemella sp. oral taxon 928]AXI26452.1 hypothetical protein CG018_02835 [Gemella sp. ND 6198]
MKIRISKNHIGQLCFYFSYSIFLLFSLLSTSLYYKYFYGATYKTILIVCLLFLILKELTHNKYNYKDIILLLLVIISSVITFMAATNTEQKTIPLMIVFIYSARNIDFKKIAQISLVISSFVLGFVIVSSYFNIIENFFVNKADRTREYLGFRYALNSATIFSNIVFLKIYIDKEKIKLKTLGILFIINYLIYIYTDSRLTSFISLCFIIFAIIIKYLPNVKLRLLYYVFPFMYLICSTISIYFTINYKMLSNWQYNLNSMLSGRLSLGQDSIQTYGYGLFWKKLYLVGNGLDVNGEINFTSYNYVDNLYVQVLQRYGIIFIILLIIILTVVMFYITKLKDNYLLVIFALLAIHGIIDDLIIYPYYNTFWFILGHIYYNSSTKFINIHKKQRNLNY